ncbi:hypothetical protein MHU86_4764 [Fragilaria crotonensis]|nr:hypothetical protein MHU86_4764 [Fragilaria crotonensis]
MLFPSGSSAANSSPIGPKHTVEGCAAPPLVSFLVVVVSAGYGSHHLVAWYGLECRAVPQVAMSESQGKSVCGVAGESVVYQLHLSWSAWDQDHVPVRASGDVVGESAHVVEVPSTFLARVFEFMSKVLGSVPIVAVAE